MNESTDSRLLEIHAPCEGISDGSKSETMMSQEYSEELQFEWDESKARINLKKHEVSFLTAAMVFDNERISRIDDREDYGERRFITLGRVEFAIYRVVYSEPGDNLVRIISAQKASRDEREFYFSEIFP